MSLERRLALLAAAEAADAWIVEDDYDGEFCYRRPRRRRRSGASMRPAASSTSARFSKTLFPALRLGYVLAPPALVEVFERVRRRLFARRPAQPAGRRRRVHRRGPFRRAHPPHAKALCRAPRRAAATPPLAGSPACSTSRRPTPACTRSAGCSSGRRKPTSLSALRRGTSPSLRSRRYCITPIVTKGLVLGFSGVRSEEIRKGVEILGQVLEEASRAPAPPSVDQRRGQVSETR